MCAASVHICCRGTEADSWVDAYLIQEVWQVVYKAAITSHHFELLSGLGGIPT